MTRYPALPGYYKVLFLYLEPITFAAPLVLVIKEGANWFYNQLVPPTGPPPTDLDIRAIIAIWQLSISYMLLFILVSFLLRGIRDAFQGHLYLQEKLTGMILFSLSLADVTHVALTFYFLPVEWKYSPWLWNATTHGNISLVVLLFVSRMCWFIGIGRKRYYFGQPTRDIASQQ